MTIHQKIGKKIRIARKHVGMTQSELAKKLGKTGAAIAYLEQGKRRISTDVLTSIAQLTGKPLSFFYEDEDDSGKQLKKQLSELRSHLDGIKTLLDSAEREKMESENMLHLFRTVLEKSSDAIIVWDPETGRALDCNEKACVGLGYTREEFLQKTIMEIESGIPTLATWKECVKEAQKRRHFILKTIPMNKEGELLQVEVSVNYVDLEDKAYMVGMARFLKDRERELSLAEESYKKNRILLESFTMGVFFTDIKGNITEVNSVIWDMLEIPPESRAEDDFSLLQQAIKAAGVDRLVQDCLQAKKEVSKVLQFDTAWKKGIEISIRIIPIEHLSYLMGVQGIIEPVKKKGLKA